MNCYICNNDRFETIHRGTRDIPDLNVLRCSHCRLVFLESFDHISNSFYSEGEMTSLDVKEYLEKYQEENRSRASLLHKRIKGKTVLDFGCGAGGFLNEIADSTECSGLEPDKKLAEHVRSTGINCYSSLTEIDRKFQVITIIHVIEHLKDPRKTLTDLIPFLEEGGEIIIETPNSEEALISLYNCESYKDFTYWGCHLFLFNTHTLSRLSNSAWFDITMKDYVQRYPLSNHLYWILHGKPGGHLVWKERENLKIMTKSYEQFLHKNGISDTLLMSITPRTSNENIIRLF